MQLLYVYLGENCVCWWESDGLLSNPKQEADCVYPEQTEQCFPRVSERQMMDKVETNKPILTINSLCRKLKGIL